MIYMIKGFEQSEIYQNVNIYMIKGFEQSEQKWNTSAPALCLDLHVIYWYLTFSFWAVEATVSNLQVKLHMPGS